MEHGENSGLVGDVNLTDFDPTRFLYNFDWGQESVAPDGRTVREWTVFAADKEIEVAPGVFFPAWTYNGQVPVPRSAAGRATCCVSTSATPPAMPHTIHFHGIHPPSMDGVTPVVPTAATSSTSSRPSRSGCTCITATSCR